MLLRPPVTVRVHPTIDEIDAQEWDSILTAEDQQATHRFVRACQLANVEDATYRHVLVYQNGRLAGIASLSAIKIAVDVLTASGTLRTAVAQVRRARPEFLRVPVLFCGLPVSFGQSCIRWRSDADTVPILDAVLEVMNRFAAELDVRILCFKEHTDAETGCLDYLCTRGFFRAPSMPACRLRLRWRSFEEYLSGMRAGYRRQLRSNLRVGDGAGLRHRVLVDFDRETDRIFDLYAQVMDRAEHRLELLNAAFFRQLNRELRNESRAILLEREHDLLGAAILLSRSTTATFLLAGIDYVANRECHTYFNLVAAVVREAIDSNAHVLELGQTSYQLKSRLGGELSPLWLYVRGRGAFPHRLLSSTSALLFPTTPVPRRRVFRDNGSAAITGFGPIPEESEWVL